MLIDIYVNGEWDTSLELHKEVVVYNKGMVYQMDQSLYEGFIDQLENWGFDCYLCPQLFSHPEWNGIIKYDEY